MIIKDISLKISGLATALLLATPLGASAAGSNYIGFSLEGAATNNTFGGFNTAGSFSNADTQSSNEGFAALQFGRHNGLTLGGAGFTPELEFLASTQFSTVSASFPGLPSPSKFYTSTISINRLGINLWTDLGSAAGMNIELGGGLGAQQTSFFAMDTVVDTTGQRSFNSGYAMIGIRASRAISPSAVLTVSARVFGSTPISAPLTTVSPSFAAGNLTHSMQDATIGIGLRFFLPKN